MSSEFVYVSLCEYNYDEKNKILLTLKKTSLY